MMTETYTAPRESADAAEARRDFFDYAFPYWEVATAPERFVSEDDMPVYDTSADESYVSNEDWEAMAEAMWNDHRENM